LLLLVLADAIPYEKLYNIVLRVYSIKSYVLKLGTAKKVLNLYKEEAASCLIASDNGSYYGNVNQKTAKVPGCRSTKSLTAI